MKQFNYVSTLLMAVATAAVLGCASTPTQEGTGEYVDDSVITTKVKAALLNEPTLKSLEFKVDTFKGTVQLSGWVRSNNDIVTAMHVARDVRGVKSVKDDMQVK
jgi:osmotically-inducible protein OsmY